MGILSRGGQGGVTLGKVLTYAATYDGKYTNAIPKYGAERRGAPVFSSVRIFDRPVKRHAQILQPLEILSLDYTLVPRFYPNDHFQGQGSITLNAADIPDEYFNYTPAKLGYVNIQEIAKRHGLVKSGSTLIGIPALGALAKTTGMVSLKSLHKAIDKLFPDSQYLQANHDAVEECYNETQIVTLDQMKQMDCPMSERRIHPIVRPMAGVAGRTSEWRTQRPELKVEACTKCMKCVVHCPDDCISLDIDGLPVIDQYYCKGCMICEAVCPVHGIIAIETLPGDDKDA